jgi:hypothetical protein
VGPYQGLGSSETGFSARTEENLAREKVHGGKHFMATKKKAAKKKKKH